MKVDDLINVVVTITLVEMMVTIGLSVSFVELRDVCHDWWLLTRALLANYVVVPAVTFGLLLVFKPHPLVAVGFLILAVCPGAPYGPPCATIAKGNVPVAVALMVILAGLLALFAPLLLNALIPIVAGDQTLPVETVQIALTLLGTQIVPLAVGAALRQWRPVLADRLEKSAQLVSRILNILVVVLILATRYELLLAIQLRGFVGMVVLLIASWTAGWLLGGRKADIRTTMTLTTSLRNVGVGLVIATGAFPGTPAVTAVLVYGLFEIFGSIALAVLWARLQPPMSDSSVATIATESKQ